MSAHSDNILAVALAGFSGLTTAVEWAGGWVSKLLVAAIIALVTGFAAKLGSWIASRVLREKP